MTKISEIASAANVSVKTVSRVLNGRPFVREDVRDRVLHFADVLGYQRKGAA
jgi:DNA-binding LacI/PurR family transcriptional regulator